MAKAEYPMYERILREAHMAADEAQKGFVENPMAFDCGFAWVKVDRRHAFTRYCRLMAKQVDNRLYGSTAYPSGWMFWQPGNFRGQSLDGHLLGANAFAKVLMDYGIDATVSCRYD